MLSNNLGALTLIENPYLHERSKHIDISYHFIRDLGEQGELNIAYIPTDEMATDGKPLAKPRFRRSKELIGLID